MDNRKNTAYQEILKICQDCGIVPDAYMTEEKLLIFIDKLLEHIGVTCDKI